MKIFPFRTRTRTLLAIIVLGSSAKECSCFSIRRNTPVMMAKKPLSSISVESGLRKRGFRYVIGSDEAGRGCIAGPVVAASCCIKTDMLENYRPIAGVDDSKKIDESQRNLIYEHIVSQPDIYAFHVAEVSNLKIDELNILKATMECFKNAIEGLASQENFPHNETYGSAFWNTPQPV